MGSKFLVHLRRQWMGALALFLVLTGGVAYAANTVFSEDIVNGEVKTADLANNSIRSTKIGSGQVTAQDLAAPEAWHRVQAGSTTTDRCADPATVGVFCSEQTPPNALPWMNLGGAHTSAAFYKDQLGIVHLKGLVMSNGSNQTQFPIARPIFRLPPTYRPARARVFPSVGSEGVGDEVVIGRIDVWPDGLVKLVQDCIPFGENGFSCSANGPHATLDAVAFRPDE
jgi:hypothetical protein